MLEVEHIEKSRQSGGLNFAFRGIEQVMNSLHVIFKKHGVFVITDIIAHEMSEFETKSGTKGFHHLSRVAFHLTASDGSTCTITSLGEAMDYGDKGASKTLSIALKYALMNLFLIPTKEMAIEDPDADSTHSVKADPKPEPKPKADPRAVLAQRIEADPEAKWFEVVAFAKGEYAGKPLGEVAMEGDHAAIQKLLDYIDPVALEHELAVKRLKAAIAEAKSNAEASAKDDANDDTPTQIDPKTGKTVKCPF
jgi:hypothetical protein